MSKNYTERASLNSLGRRMLQRQTQIQRRFSQFIVVFVVSVLPVLAVSLKADSYQYTLGAGIGVVGATGEKFFNFQNDVGFNGQLGIRLGPGWEMKLDYAKRRLLNNVNTDSSGTLEVFANNARVDKRSTQLGFTLNRKLLSEDSGANFWIGLGSGLMIWEVVDRDQDTVYNVTGQRNEQVDFGASEIFLRGEIGVELDLSRRWLIEWRGQADFLTGAGAEFATAVSDSRDRWFIASLVTLNFRFGSVSQKLGWADMGVTNTSEGNRRAIASRHRLDNDNDGIPDRLDRCPNTPDGVIVNRAGCPEDTDNDGVYDGLDDCPDTPVEARTMVDIYGCPVDSDFDGIPDYRDNCPKNQIGAAVNSAGCPIDSDGDGVPDGLDDCPNSLVGVAVDKRGCIDLSMLDRPMVLNIAYASGSFEIDPRTQERLKRLGGLLRFLLDIKLEIYGYTDNIGTARANQKLSDRRAKRVRDFLFASGVERERMKVFGRGEKRFVASNQTAEGRARNRRIEIIFHR